MGCCAPTRCAARSAVIPDDVGRHRGPRRGASAGAARRCSRRHRCGARPAPTPRSRSFRFPTPSSGSTATSWSKRLIAANSFWCRRPQAFRAEALRAAHVGDPDATDDAALRSNAPAARSSSCPASPAANKVTTPDDLVVMQRWLPMTAIPRVGLGFDVHPFSDDPARPFVLGGVVFEGERGLIGHTDADAAAHAVADALLGAAGLGDIGQHFPDTDDAVARRRLAGAAARNCAAGARRRASRSATSTAPCSPKRPSWRRMRDADGEEPDRRRSTRPSPSKPPGPNRSARSAAVKAWPAWPSRSWCKAC